MRNKLLSAVVLFVLSLPEKNHVINFSTGCCLVDINARYREGVVVGLLS